MPDIIKQVFWFVVLFERNVYPVWNCTFHGKGCNLIWDFQWSCLLPKYLHFTCTWLKNYLMYFQVLELVLVLANMKNTCTWLKYPRKYLTPTLMDNQVLSQWEKTLHMQRLLSHWLKPCATINWKYLLVPLYKVFMYIVATMLIPWEIHALNILTR